MTQYFDPNPIAPSDRKTIPYRMNGINDPKIDVKLARLFGVSRKAVRIRLGEYDLPFGGT